MQNSGDYHFFLGTLGMLGIVGPIIIFFTGSFSFSAIDFILVYLFSLLRSIVSFPLISFGDWTLPSSLYFDVDFYFIFLLLMYWLRASWPILSRILPKFSLRHCPELIAVIIFRHSLSNLNGIILRMLIERLSWKLTEFFNLLPK